MFNSLTGIITGKLPKQLFLDTHGIEWDICVPDSNLELLPTVGSEAKVYIIGSLGSYIASSLVYLSESMDSGFLMTAITLAMATAILTAVASLVGKDDIRELKGCKEEEEKE